MLRTDRWKLNYLSWGRSELFNLENDPGEFENVIDDPGERRDREGLDREKRSKCLHSDASCEPSARCPATAGRGGFVGG